MAFPDGGQEEESLLVMVVVMEADIQAAVAEDIPDVAAAAEVLLAEEGIPDVVAVVPLQQAWQTTAVLLAPWSTSFYRFQAALVLAYSTVEPLGRCRIPAPVGRQMTAPAGRLSFASDRTVPVTMTRAVYGCVVMLGSVGVGSGTSSHIHHLEPPAMRKINELLPKDRGRESNLGRTSRTCRRQVTSFDWHDLLTRKLP